MLTAKEDTYNTVTQRIMELLRDNDLPWRYASSIPINAKTKKPYQGVNVPLLWLANMPSPYWATRKMWEELGATVIVEDPVDISFFLFSGSGGKRFPLFKTYKVYNLDHVRGCDDLRLDLYHDPTYNEVEEFLGGVSADMRDSGRAWYDLVNDVIYCPPRETFASLAGYYTTKLHELIHWTGKRLGRKFGAKNSKEYAEEELIAELGSCFLAAKLEIPARLQEMPTHASYIGAWLEILGNDAQAFFRAAAAAQKAVNYLCESSRSGACRGNQVEVSNIG